jgi:hypothetical protein
MPKLRPLQQRIPDGSETEPAKAPANPHGFQRGRQKTGGRERGVPNAIPASAREAIAVGLARYGRDACGRPDLDGLSAFVYKCAEADLELGAKLLMCITPRTADIAVRREVEFRSLADLDASLAAAGLPTSREVFRLDFRGSDSVEDITEAEVVEAEVAAKGE